MDQNVANPTLATFRQEPEQNLTRDYWRIFQKHRRLGITFFLIIVGSTFFYTVVHPKIYEATTTVLIEQGQSNASSFRDIFSVYTVGRDYYQTQYQLLKSRSVGRAVMDKLNLWPQYSGAKDPVSAFLRSVEVKPVKDSRLATLTASATNADQAADVANAMVDYYVNLNMNNKSAMSRQAANWLEIKIKDVRKKLEKSETQFEVVKLRKELVDLNEKYLPKHPEILRTEVRLRILEDQVGEELGELKTDNLLGLYNELGRESESNRKVYEQMLIRLKETIASEGVEDTNVFVVDIAEVPPRHARPRMGRNLLLAIIVGAFGSLGLTLAFESLDHTIKSPEEIERTAELPVLGVIPQWDTRKREFIVEEDRMSGEAEAFRAIRTNLLFSSPDKPLQTLLVTSPNPEEGKSIVAINLAMTIAQSGARTLLIDGDLRKPRLEEAFGLVGTMGLTEAITTNRNPSEFVQGTQFKNLFLMSSGQIPPMPSELLGSQKMRSLTAHFRDQFDFVVIDAPPFMAVTDPVILGTFLDGVIVVVRYGRTAKSILSRLKQRFIEVRAPLLGVVLNSLNMKRERYQQSTYSYTYSRYSRGEQTKKKSSSSQASETPDVTPARTPAQTENRLPS